MARKKNLFDPDAAKRDYEDALTKAKRYLDSAAANFERNETSTASGYLIAAAEMLGLALGHLQYLEHVGREELGRYRGQRDRLEAMQATLRSKLFDPTSELRFNPTTKARRLKRSL